MQAKAYAQLGDTGAAMACIRKAEAAAERISPGSEPDETGYVQPGLVNVQVAEALLSLGDLEAARVQATAAVGTQAHDRGRVHRLAMLCEIQLRQGRRTGPRRPRPRWPSGPREWSRCVCGTGCGRSANSF